MLIFTKNLNFNLFSLQRKHVFFDNFIFVQKLFVTPSVGFRFSFFYQFKFVYFWLRFFFFSNLKNHCHFSLVLGDLYLKKKKENSLVGFSEQLNRVLGLTPVSNSFFLRCVRRFETISYLKSKVFKKKLNVFKNFGVSFKLKNFCFLQQKKIKFAFWFQLLKTLFHNNVFVKFFKFLSQSEQFFLNQPLLQKVPASLGLSHFSHKPTGQLLQKRIFDVPQEFKSIVSMDLNFRKVLVRRILKQNNVKFLRKQNWRLPFELASYVPSGSKRASNYVFWFTKKFFKPYLVSLAKLAVPVQKQFSFLRQVNFRVHSKPVTKKISRAAHSRAFLTVSKDFAYQQNLKTLYYNSFFAFESLKQRQQIKKKKKLTLTSWLFGFKSKFNKRFMPIKPFIFYLASLGQFSRFSRRFSNRNFVKIRRFPKILKKPKGLLFSTFRRGSSSSFSKRFLRIRAKKNKLLFLIKQRTVVDRFKKAGVISLFSSFSFFSFFMRRRLLGLFRSFLCDRGLVFDVFCKKNLKILKNIKYHFFREFFGFKRKFMWQTSKKKNHFQKTFRMMRVGFGKFSKHNSLKKYRFGSKLKHAKLKHAFSILSTKVSLHRSKKVVVKNTVKFSRRKKRKHFTFLRKKIKEFGNLWKLKKKSKFRLSNVQTQTIFSLFKNRSVVKFFSKLRRRALRLRKSAFAYTSYDFYPNVEYGFIEKIPKLDSLFFGKETFLNFFLQGQSKYRGLFLKLFKFLTSYDFFLRSSFSSLIHEGVSKLLMLQPRYTFLYDLKPLFYSYQSLCFLNVSIKQYVLKNLHVNSLLSTLRSSTAGTPGKIVISTRTNSIFLTISDPCGVTLFQTTTGSLARVYKPRYRKMRVGFKRRREIQKTQFKKMLKEIKRAKKNKTKTEEQKRMFMARLKKQTSKAKRRKMFTTSRSFITFKTLYPIFFVLEYFLNQPKNFQFKKNIVSLEKVKLKLQNKIEKLRKLKKTLTVEYKRLFAQLRSVLQTLKKKQNKTVFKFAQSFLHDKKLINSLSLKKIRENFKHSSDFRSLVGKLTKLLFPKLNYGFSKKLRRFVHLKTQFQRRLGFSRFRKFYRKFFDQKISVLSFFRLKNQKSLFGLQKFNFYKLFKHQACFLKQVTDTLMQQRFFSFIVVLKNFEQKTYEFVLFKALERFVLKFLANKKKIFKYLVPDCYRLLFLNRQLLL